MNRKAKITSFLLLSPTLLSTFVGAGFVDISATANSCPLQVEALTTKLLRDLPSYANRINQRSRRSDRTQRVSGSMILAGRPEFAPLSLGPGVYSDAPSTDSQPVQQIFFTTLERQYAAGKAVQLQQYHWLFLTQTNSGWQLVMMFSQTGSYPSSKPPTPPRDSSQGVIAQAVRIWLRDCQAVRVRSPEK